MKKLFIFTIFLLSFIGTASAHTEDKTIVITSDWHLSDSRSFDADCYYAWTDKNQSRILAFLNSLISDRDNWEVLVLNGDIFEFWRCPTDRYMVADAEGNVVTDVDYLKLIKEKNADIFAALEDLRKAGKEIVYMPGNHDLSVSAEDIEAAFPGLFTCSFDTQGTGIYEPFGENSPVAIEHGNRYEYFNAPYQHGAFGSDYAESTSLIPPGYFTSRLGASATVYKASLSSAKAKVDTAKEYNIPADENDADNRTFLATIWNAIRAGVGSPSFDVKTLIDGIGTEEHSVSPWADYTVSESNNPPLFKDSWTVANWAKRQQLNNVPVYVPLVTSLLSASFYTYLDDLAFTERLNNQSLTTLVCVFGHSHMKVLETRKDSVKGDVVYLNEGAWVDNTKVCTYGVIRYKSGIHRYDVELRQFDADGEDTMIDCKYLYVPENNATKLADGTLQFNAKAVLVDADPTSIEDITSTNTNASNVPHAYYNLNGQRLTSPVRGINIINGKKIVFTK